MSNRLGCWTVVLLANLPPVLAGCGGSAGGNVSTPPAGPQALSGRIMGGRQPIAGSTVTAYAAGNAAGASAIQIGQAITDSSGAFDIGGFSPVPAAGQIIYVISTGGNSGGGGNSAIRLMSVAGAYCVDQPVCDFVSTIDIDELSTVASVYALAPFLSLSGTTVNVAGGAPGLPNAVSILANLVDAASGQAADFLAADSCTGGSGDPVNCTAMTKLDTLASVLAACVNSSSPSSTACSGLFQESMSPANAPLDTLAAMLNIAGQPAARNQGTGLYALLPPDRVYAPSLEAAPNDWSLALNYSGGGLSAPAGLAVDSVGNIWVADNISPGIVSTLAPNGSVRASIGYNGAGLNEPIGIAVDQNDNVWVANWAQGSGTSVSELAMNGKPISSASGYAGGGISGPIDVTIAADGSAWIANFGNSSLTHLSPLGSPILGPIQIGGLDFPTKLALDALGDVWVANQSGNTLSEYDSSGTPLSASGYGGGFLTQPYGLALDENGNPWVASLAGDYVVELIGGDTPSGACPPIPVSGETGCPVSANGFAGGGLSGPNELAIDGLGQVWVGNFHGNSLSELATDGSALSPASGYIGGGLSQPYGVAVDASGSVWVADFGNNSVTQFVGIAAPVKTPLIGLPQAAR